MPTYKIEKAIKLQNGNRLEGAYLYYTIYGELLPDRQIVWVCHPLTANADVKEWWAPLFSEHGGWIDTQLHTVICVNIPGSCYGSISAEEINKHSKKKNVNAPLSNKDVVECFDALRKSLGIRSIDFLIGGSLGGQQALQWAVKSPELIKNLVLIACNARHSSWGIAFNHLQRLAIQASNKPEIGLSLARQLAMLSYRSYDDFEKSHQLNDSSLLEQHQIHPAVSYLNYQGTKLVNRFQPESYVLLSLMMDAHHISEEGESKQDSLRRIASNTLVIGIDSDLLFPLQEQQFLVENISTASLKILESTKGHDAFLAEAHKVSSFIKEHFKLSDYAYS